MSDVNELIGSILKRTNKLIQVLHALEDENKNLKEKQAQLLETIEENQNQINELKHKHNSYLISDTIKQTEGSGDVKKQIDEMVREIDRCIELLNK